MKNVLLVMVIFMFISCTADNTTKKNNVKELIHQFHDSINKSDYVMAAKYGCEVQEAIKSGNFGIGSDEIGFLQNKFNWNGKKIIQLTKLAGFYEVKLEGKNGVSMQNIYIGKEEGVDCIYFMK